MKPAAGHLEAERHSAGFDQDSLEIAARVGLSNDAFEEIDDEADSVVEEIYPEADGGFGAGDSGSNLPSEQTAEPSLTKKLDAQAIKLGCQTE